MALSFYEEISRFRDFDLIAHLRGITEKEILRALRKDSLSEYDFLALLAPKAQEYLELMAQKARQLTLSHFGKVIFLYAPLYLSNYCENDCVYCGFNRSNPIARKRLTIEELEKEAIAIAQSGLRHLLVLSGDSRRYSSLTYIRECVGLLRKYFSSISIEIYPLSIEEYAHLAQEGVDGLTIYQETYDQTLYAELHGQGPKSDYRFRLDAAQRAAAAHIRQVNIGALLGLGEFRQEVFFTGLHCRWLTSFYPDTEVGLSLPRLQPQAGNFAPRCRLEDREFTQMLLALRIFLPRQGITISTRESAELRGNLIGLGVTRMSAGSRTEVGGYACAEKSEGQFETADKSSVAEIKEMITAKGYQPVFQDWQAL